MTSGGGSEGGDFSPQLRDTLTLAFARVLNFAPQLRDTLTRGLEKKLLTQRPPRARREGARTFPHSQECGNDVGRGVGGMGLERGDLGDVAAT